MAVDRPYKVKNLRARKMLSLFGTLLAPQAGKGHGTTFLTEDQFNSAHVQTLIKMGRLTVLESPKPAVAAPAPPAPLPPKPELEVPTPVVEPEPELEPEPPSPEPVEPPQEPASEEEEALVPPPGPSLVDNSYLWSEDELFALNTSDQKTILRSRELKLNGKEGDRVQRILGNQGI